jgi:poly(A) polymerase
VLQEAGHRYVVGGAVRDIIVGRAQGFRRGHQPRPEEVRALFRLADHRPPLQDRACDERPRDHRGLHLPRHAGCRIHETDEHGRVLRDNVFGSMAEDATRRDFTVNALYYDPATRRSSTTTTAWPTSSKRPCA